LSVFFTGLGNLETSFTGGEKGFEKVKNAQNKVKRSEIT